MISIPLHLKRLSYNNVLYKGTSPETIRLTKYQPSQTTEILVLLH